VDEPLVEGVLPAPSDRPTGPAYDPSQSALADPALEQRSTVLLEPQRGGASVHLARLSSVAKTPVHTVGLRAGR